MWRIRAFRCTAAVHNCNKRHVDWCTFWQQAYLNLSKVLWKRRRRHSSHAKFVGRLRPAHQCKFTEQELVLARDLDVSVEKGEEEEGILGNTALSRPHPFSRRSAAGGAVIRRPPNQPREGEREHGGRLCCRGDWREGRSCVATASLALTIIVSEGPMY